MRRQGRIGAALLVEAVDTQVFERLVELLSVLPLFGNLTWFANECETMPSDVEEQNASATRVVSNSTAASREVGHTKCTESRPMSSHEFNRSRG